MVAFDKPQGRFNFRVAAVVVHNGRVLLDRNTKNDYWVLPGGHPDMMESMETALQREMFEEIGVRVSVVRLLWVVENFFIKKRPVHELSFFFLVTLEPNSPLLQSDGPFYGEEHDHTLIYQWYPIESTGLASLPLYPGFLTKSLLNLPSSPQHVVFDDTHSPTEASARSQTGQPRHDAVPPIHTVDPPKVLPINTEKKWNKV